MADEKHYLTVMEMAAFLGVGRSTAYQLTKMEGFPAVRICTKVVIPRDRLVEWIGNGGADARVNR